MITHKLHIKATERYKSLIGIRFTRLVVISVNDESPITVNCLCDCGAQTKVIAKRLRNRNTKSCGCLRPETSRITGENSKNPRQKPNGESARNRLIRTYKKNARNAHREYTLTTNEFTALTSSDCMYCGSKPSNTMQSDWGKNTTGSYVYNGLDRINNDLGYTIDNVVPCCYNCNRCKWTRTQQEFMEWINKLIQHNTKRTETE